MSILLSVYKSRQCFFFSIETQLIGNIHLTVSRRADQALYDYIYSTITITITTVIVMFSSQAVEWINY